MKLARLKINSPPFAAVLLALCLNSCKKDEVCDHPSLPCETHEGKNTFGCLIDGAPFVADVKFTVGGPVVVSGSFNEESKLLLIQGNRGNDNGSIDAVSFMSVVSNGVSVYNMTVTSSTFKGYLNFVGSSCEYYHDQNNKGNLEITFIDLEKNIISGTFSMTLINSDCTKSSLVITEGRFDFGY
jgi:hypothetical protein